jgi:hypothetical protein
VVSFGSRMVTELLDFETLPAASRAQIEIVTERPASRPPLHVYVVAELGMIRLPACPAFKM